MNILPCGDSAVSIRFGEEISPLLNARVTGFACAVETAQIQGVLELVPSYCALMVRYDPLVLSYKEIVAALEGMKPAQAAAEEAGLLVELPVCYGGEYGPDLAYVAQHANLSVEEVVKLHTRTEYPVYMLGFTPGFPYLGGMETQLATPRLQTPRTQVAAGSVGIAGAQTGVYPMASPGGWQIIGRTPLKLYDPARDKPFLLAAGMKLRFVPIDEATFRALAGGVAP